MTNLIKTVLESLKDQKEFYGDELFELVKFTSNNETEIKKSVNKDKPKFKLEPNSLFENFYSCDSLDELYNSIHNCQKCPLGATRNKFVFGVGNKNADVMLIGEAPGAEEDKQGIPFVGRAGQLLTDILKAINFDRNDVYIANILKCRPPNNRNPLPAEMKECTPYLFKQIELIKPKAILCLGLIAANSLISEKLSLTKMRENVYDIHGIKAMVTYHPAALLRNPNWKRGCWEDVKKFKLLYNSVINN